MEIKTGLITGQTVTFDDGTTDYSVDVKVLCVKPTSSDNWTAYVSPVPYPDVEDIVYSHEQQEDRQNSVKRETHAVLTDENRDLARELLSGQETIRKLKAENKKLRKKVDASEKLLLKLALGKLGVTMIEEPDAGDS